MDPNEMQLRRSASARRLGNWLCLLGVVFRCTWVSAATVAASESGPLEFNRDIRPILSENCYLCHGPDRNTRKGKLRLDQREEAVAKQALVPGKPDESHLLRRLLTKDPDEVMPPPDTHKKISPAQREVLRRWIAQGAEYQPHWSYLIPKKPVLPQVKRASWVGKPIDAFILEVLERRGIEPSPEADRATLLRRLSLDLIGLPPSAEEVAAFVNDRRSDAYSRQVERLLQSPHFGERMAVGWLDLVRYADTVGYHGDQNINVFPYRDYVIRSFNENKPFDRFTIEQIAGDLLPNATVEQRVATGFNRLNMVTREGGAQPKEYLAKYAADRVRTVAATWLGSTMGCAECHDHKFDPFSMKDFYSLAAFFADVKQWGVYQDYNYTPNPDLKGWSNDHPFPPELEVESPYLQQRAATIRSSLDIMLDRLRGSIRAGGEWDAWLKSVRAFAAEHPTGWSASGATLLSPPKNASLSSDGEVRLAGARENQDLVLTLGPPNGWVGAVRVELLPDEAHRIARGGGRLAVSVRLSLQRGTNAPKTLPVYFADATHKDPRYANGYEILGVKDTWRTSFSAADQPQTGVWVLEKPVFLSAGDRLQVTLKSDALSRFRVSTSPFPSADPLKSGLDGESARLLRRKPAAWSGDGGRRLLEAALWSGVLAPSELGAYRELHGQFLECRGGKNPTVVTVAWTPTVTRVLPRGNWQDESGAPLTPMPPQSLLHSAWNDSRPMNRLDLARWLVSPDNPLTARVIMNRLWKQFFGNGISASVDDLGSQGEWPTHPALLDWLAVEFQERNWDLKSMIRTIVMSSTYRQSSDLRPELKDLDPNNRLLASQNPRRLEAEFVRDNALKIAGLLQPDIGGPSIRPYQPAGYYAPLQFPDRDYQAQRDDRQYRRGLYMHWQRTFLHPMLANFDAPSREECTATRSVSNTPQQALTLLNDPSFVEAARVLAQDVLGLTANPSSKRARQPADDVARLNKLFGRALGRLPTAAEAQSLGSFVQQQRAYYRDHGSEANDLIKVGFSPSVSGIETTELAAWTSVCRVILNLHETLTRY